MIKYIFLNCVLLVAVMIQIAFGKNSEIPIKNIKCNYCHKMIIEDYFRLDNKKYHQDCYEKYVQPRCSYCNNAIENAYNIYNQKNYHSYCFKNFILEKCDVCGAPLEADYIVDSWNNKYHDYHLNGSETCESCGRLIAKKLTGGGLALNQNRHVCNICSGSLVTEKSDIEYFKDKVMAILQNVGIINMPRSIPIKLVKSQIELDRMSTIRLGDIQGYTKYEYEKVNNKIMGESFEIYILSHLHKIVFEAVLAHELMHVYLFKNNIKLSSQKREGFCNLGSRLVYEDYNDQFSNIKLDLMKKNKDPDYGKGFIIMSKILKQNGWHDLLINLEKW